MPGCFVRRTTYVRGREMDHLLSAKFDLSQLNALISPAKNNSASNINVLKSAVASLAFFERSQGADGH